MSLTAQIGSSELSFKLSQKLVASLAEKFAFSFEDGWNTVSTRTVDNIQKRLKREKRRANPTAAIKHPRTAFSFFTQKQRPVCQAAHPEATFGQLSRFVSEGWKALTPAQMADFKALETADKSRYQVERDAVLAKVAAESSSAPAVVATDVPVVAEATSKKARKPKSATATPVSEAVVVVAAAPVAEKKVKTPKASKAAAPVVEAAVAPVAVAEKKAKTPKATKAAAATSEVATPVVVAEAVAPVVAKAAKVAKPKAVKA